MDQVQSMRVFFRVVEAKSFTRAAESMAMTKGAVTKHIQALESRVRFKLINRTTRRFMLTPDGAAYYERASRLLSELDDLEDGLNNVQSSPRGRLRIDVSSAAASLLIIPSLPEFFLRYPEIQLDVGVSDRNVDLVTDNVDCVIRGGEISDQSLVARRIGSLRFVTAASPGYLQRYGTPMHPKDMEKNHRVVRYFLGHSRRLHIDEYRREHEFVKIDAPYSISVNENGAFINAVLAGLGISQLLNFVAQPLLESGGLVQILHEWHRDPIPVYVVYPPNRHLSAKVRVFVEWVAELFASDPLLQRTAGDD